MKRNRLPRFEYDPEADGLYIRLRLGRVHETDSLDGNEDISLDLDRSGRLLGIEVWPASRYLSSRVLNPRGLPRRARSRPAALR